MASLTRKMAGLLAESRLMTAGRTLYRQNETNWDLPMSRIGKLKAGGYIILRDYADGLFPPKFEDQQKAYDAEKEYCVTLPGMDSERLRMVGMQKPFWSAKALRSFMGDFIRLAGHFADLGIRPRSRILELGCGKGWMAEALAQMGYDVLGTTLAEMDVEHAGSRIAALRAKGVPNRLEFLACPMESADQAVRDRPPFDLVFIYEALHHAYDWRAALTAAAGCLRPGGWLVLGNEPNLLHTLVSYRVARLSNTHEVGMSRREIRRHLLFCGFDQVRILNRRPGFLVVPHWIAARKA